VVVSALFFSTSGASGVCEKTLALGSSINRGDGSSLRQAQCANEEFEILQRLSKKSPWLIYQLSLNSEKSTRKLSPQNSTFCYVR
jgi:hypothetical protein